MNVLRITTLTFLTLLFFSSVNAADKTDNVVQAGQSRLADNQNAQKAVDSIHEETRNIVEDYQSLLKVVDGLKVYNKILARQLANQDVEISTLEQSIANAAVIERQILPLLDRMLDALDAYVDVDIPFLLDERKARIANLRKLMFMSELSNAEKTRRIFEAFQIENDFGNTIESYKGKLNIGDRSFDVDYLRVGRVSYMYRTVGSDNYGYWDRNSQSWQEIGESLYKRNIDKGIKMARQEMAPELLTIPVSNSKENS